MRNLIEINEYRRTSEDVVTFFGSVGGNTSGMFDIPSPRTGVTLKVIACAEDGWDHVSVSLPNRTPNWIEMQHIYRTFFKANETVWEYHVPPDKHINMMPHCLHLWRKHNFEIPMPPMEFV
jgi:hypothetical protein